MRFTRLLCLGLFTLALAGCFHPFRIKIEQGNVITQQQVQSLRKGMSSYQVTKLLGSPLLNNVYADNRTVYVYTVQKAYRPMHTKRLMITLIRDRVTDIRYTTS